MSVRRARIRFSIPDILIWVALCAVIFATSRVPGCSSPLLLLLGLGPFYGVQAARRRGGLVMAGAVLGGITVFTARAVANKLYYTYYLQECVPDLVLRGVDVDSIAYYFTPVFFFIVHLSAGAFWGVVIGAVAWAMTRFRKSRIFGGNRHRVAISSDDSPPAHTP